MEDDPLPALRARDGVARGHRLFREEGPRRVRRLIPAMSQVRQRDKHKCDNDYGQSRLELHCSLLRGWLRLGTLLPGAGVRVSLRGPVIPKVLVRVGSSGGSHTSHPFACGRALCVSSLATPYPAKRWIECFSWRLSRRQSSCSRRSRTCHRRGRLRVLEHRRRRS